MLMLGKRQLRRTATIDAPVPVVYRLFMDNAELPNWAPVVDAITSEEGGDASGVGRTRTCAVTLDGKAGMMAETCVEAELDTRASFVVVDDSFGFTKMVEDYGFTVHFASAACGWTIATMETFYTPANPVAWLMNKLVMRRKFAGIVDDLLAGLGRLAAERHRASI